METTPVAGIGEAGPTARREVVERLRREVITGCYEPPADALADRIVRVVLAHQGMLRPIRR